MLRFAIHEGRNRQVRRMCEKKRIWKFPWLRPRRGKDSLSPLGDLPRGAWRYLDAGRGGVSEVHLRR